MSFWKKNISLHELQSAHRETAVDTLGIEFLEVGADFLKARAPAGGANTWNGAMHQGVHAVLAETLGSCGAHYASPESTRAVGVSISVNALKPVTAGWITGVARQLSTSEESQVWTIEVSDERGETVAVSQISLALLRSQPRSGD